MGLAGVDTGRLSSYSEAVAADPVLIALRDRIAFEFRDDLPSTFAEMEVLLTDGTRVIARHDAGVPMTDVVAQGARLEEKFSALVGPVLGAARAHDLAGQIAGLDSLADLRGLLSGCAVRPD